MLQPPYTRYEHLYVYHLDLPFAPEVHDPDMIGTWLEDGSAILFFHRPKDNIIQLLCKKHGCNIIYQADLSYDDWEAGQKIEVFQVEDLTIAPVWEPCAADIRLDPSVIFGSGFHPSTRLCLETLLQYLDTPEIAINSMLDLGCGTGLLAITAALKGVGHITAVDHNPLACTVARHNIQLNNVKHKITVHEADLRSAIPSTNVDLVIANLYRELLEHLFSTPSFWQASYYILAGFIPAMEEQLLAALPQKNLRLLERRKKEKWCLWVIARV